MIIAIDFDGTCVSHEFPLVGKDIGSIPILKELIEQGHQLILYTMRSASSLQEAIQWFIDAGIELYGVQFNPTQAQWTSSNKCYAHMYIDDAALGIPLKYNLDLCNRPYVDWKKVRKLLIKQGLFKNTQIALDQT